MKLPSLFKNKERWPNCKHPRTDSFRERGEEDMFKTMNSVFLDPSVEENHRHSSRLTNPSEPTSFSTESNYSLESIVSEVVRSDRFFFKPGGDTSSILEETKPGGFPYRESVVLALESHDPYLDFRRSMEEMVESHGLKDWSCLEELLGWYLRVNGKKHHGFIVAAFIDLLVGIAASSFSSQCNSDHSDSFASAASGFSSFTNVGSLGMANEIEVEGKL